MAVLLPPNATELEQRTAEANRFALDDAVDLLGGFKSDAPPADFAAWLAAEWFLADFARYFPTTAALIQSGLPWLRQRGTAAAVGRALSWIDLAAAIEEDGARLHLDPGTAAAPVQLHDILHLVTRSIPAHVRFYRMFHGYDLRHFRLDRSRLEDGLLDDDSGVIVSGVKLSFGTHSAAALPDDLDEPVADAAWRIYSVRVWDDDSWHLDAWRLDSEIQLDAAGRVVFQVAAALDEPADPGPIGVMRWAIAAAELPDEELAIVCTRTDHIAAALPVPDLHAWSGAWAGTWRTPVIPHSLEFLES